MFSYSNSGLVVADIDGLIFKHHGDITEIYNNPTIVLDGVHKRFNEWISDGRFILITTARPPSMKKYTEEQLEKCAIPYHQLVMGVGRGPRFLINDNKPGKMGKTAFGITVDRDKGLGNIDLKSLLEENKTHVFVD